MSNNLQTVHKIVSMLAGEQKITLFTETGTIVDLKHNEDYDTAEIVKYLRANLNGTNVVELKLSDYTKIPAMPEIAETLQQGGIEITQIIDGKEVQGFFYPKKAQTIVAIANEVVEIPGLDNLMRHAKRAKEYGPEAIKAFLTRMLPVLQNRKHSAEDLMNFIGNSEMPLTLDGRVICYKRLDKGHKDNYWVDPHSRSVLQRVGTIVEMPEVDVDPDRYNSCSNGLHVANRTYFHNNNFSSNDTFVCLVNPEDFIAVPKGEHGKARVTRYQLIGMLTNDAHNEINRGYVKDNDSLKRLIANAIEGRYAPAIEIAKVSKRGFIELVPVTNVETRKEGTASSATIAAARSLDADPQQPMVTMNQEEKPMADGVQAVKAITPSTMPESVQKAFRMLREGTMSKAAIARELDTSTKSLDRWSEKYGYTAWKKSMDEAVQADAATETTENLEAAAEVLDTAKKESKTPVEISKPKAPTKVEIVRRMFETAKTAEDFKKIIDYKKLSKKSWADLGLSENEVAAITKASEKTNTFDLYVISDIRPKFVEMIKSIRALLKLGLKEAKDLVESKKLCSNATADQITAMKEEMDWIGVVTQTVPAGSPLPEVKPVEVKSSVQNETAPLSKAQQARLLFEQKKFKELEAFKKASKKSYVALGFTTSEIGQIIT